MATATLADFPAVAAALALVEADNGGVLRPAAALAVPGDWVERFCAAERELGALTGGELDALATGGDEGGEFGDVAARAPLGHALLNAYLESEFGEGWLSHVG